MKPVALVTGSTRGIGKAIARLLKENGFDVITHGKSKLVNNLNCDVIKPEKHVNFDLATLSENDKVFDDIFEKYGNVHCLINNAGAGVYTRGDVLNVSYDAINFQYQTNLRGTFILTQAISKRMIAQDKNIFHSIINISSSNADIVSIERAEYCIMKAAISMMSKIFAVRLARESINVYEIQPGLIKTDMTEPVATMYNEKIKQGFSPLNRWGQPEDIASAVLPLAIGNFKFSTGDIYKVDGGLFLRHY